MPFYATANEDRSKEWAKWKQHYLAKGCSEMKAQKLTYKRMGMK